MSEVVESRACQGEAALKPLFPILRQISPARSIPILQKLLDNEEAWIRRESLRILSEIDISLQATEHYLRQALLDRNRTIEIASLQQLAQWDTPQALDLLGAYLRGNLSHHLPPLYHCRIAAEILIHKGQAGQKCLCRVLRSLSRNPRNARWAKLIVDFLQSQITSMDVRQSIRRWKVSPAGLTYFFLSLRRSKHRGAKHA